VTREGEKLADDADSDARATGDVSDTDTSSTDTGQSPVGGRQVDQAAESFLDVEAEMGGDGPAGMTWGRAIDVERVSAGQVPDDYPVDITTAEALSLRLALDDTHNTTVYFEYDDGDPDDRLGRLLAVHGISPSQFADLHGRALLLRTEDGYHVPYVPEESPRGSERGVYGIGAGLGLNLLGILLLLVGLGGTVASVPFVIAWLAVTFVGLPAATYLDAWHLRTHTDWEQGPSFWALLAMVPGLNVVSSLAYLRSRRNATPIA